MHHERDKVCADLIHQARSIINADGATDDALRKIRDLMVKVADERGALFPLDDFAMPDAQGRNHVLALEDGDGMGLYLTIGLPGKEAAPHDHGIWCVNAALSGQELHRFYRRTDDDGLEGHATIEEVSEVLVAPGHGMAMADHAIHATEVIGDAPAIGLALYGYALARFPAVVWFHPDFASVRVGYQPPGGSRLMAFKVIVGNTGAVIECAADQSILHAAVGANVDYPYTCATGNCAACISELRSGRVSMLPYSDNALTLAQRADNRILACRAQPLSDLEVIWLGRGRK